MARPGRTFLRWKIELSTTAKQPHHRIDLIVRYGSDLGLWPCFLQAWDERSLFPEIYDSHTMVALTSDASGSWGCGGYLASGECLQLRYPEECKNTHIMVKELFPIIVGESILGRRWRGRYVGCRCDDITVVSIINSGSSRNDQAMQQMQSLFFFLASYKVTLKREHLLGVYNWEANAISRDDTWVLYRRYRLPTWS